MAVLRLDLPTLRSGHNRAEEVVPPDALDLPKGDWPVPLDVELDADRLGDQVTVAVRVRTESQEECARCLKAFRAPLDFGLTLYADRAGTGGRHEKELAESDDVVFHDGRHIDLAEPVREAALLARPFAPLCRPECQGLCPRCGADRNEGPCPHAAEARA
jgi:uncharacterized protein